MRRQVFQILQTGIASQPGCIPHDLPDHGMVRMLVFSQVRRQYHVRLDSSDLPRDRHRVRRGVLDMAVSSQLQELDRGPDDPGGVAGFLGAFLRLPGAGGFALGSHQNARFVPVSNFLDQNGRTAEFDVVGMRSDRQDSHRQRYLEKRYDSVIVTLVKVSPCCTALTTSCPVTTCPKTVCFPSSQSVTTWVMKNWLPLVFGPALAIERVPILCLWGFPLVSSSNR